MLACVHKNMLVVSDDRHLTPRTFTLKPTSLLEKFYTGIMYRNGVRKCMFIMENKDNN